MEENAGHGKIQSRGDADAIRVQVRQLRRRLTQQAQEARDDLARTSTVPMDALDLDDPMLEAALTDSAMQFFIRHMRALENEENAVEADVDPRREEFSVEELAATKGVVAKIQNQACPDLLAGLENERFWILLDLLTNGDTLSKHRATVELREFMTLAQRDQIEGIELEEILEGLAQLPNRSLLVDLMFEGLAQQLQRKLSSPDRSQHPVTRRA